MGGFPCQSFSIAGARKGFDDTRGTLFFKIARIASVKKSKYLFLENVPGLLNHNQGRTFETILRTLDGLGYNVCWQVLNIKNFGLLINAKTKDGYQVAYPGDSIDTAFSGENSRRGRVGSQIAHTLTTSATQAVFYLLPERENDRISHRPLTQSVKLVGRHESNEMDTRVHFIDLNPDPKLTEIARCITARHDSGISNQKAEHSGVFVESTNFTDDEKFAVAFVEPNGEVHIGRIRKLTPRECWRLQGFTDDQFDKAKATGLSDSRLYKMAGNAVTVNVISEIGKIIKKADSKI